MIPVVPEWSRRREAACRCIAPLGAPGASAPGWGLVCGPSSCCLRTTGLGSSVTPPVIPAGSPAGRQERPPGRGAGTGRGLGGRGQGTCSPGHFCGSDHTPMGCSCTDGNHTNNCAARAPPSSTVLHAPWPDCHPQALPPAPAQSQGLRWDPHSREGCILLTSVAARAPGSPQ